MLGTIVRNPQACIKRGLIMIEGIIQQHPGQVYRIDKFKAPKPARDEFVQKVRITHEFIKTLPGFIQISYSNKQVVPVSLILSLRPYGRALTRLMLQSRRSWRNTKKLDSNPMKCSTD